MKKLYLFAATLAVAAAMTSCSEKEVVEQIAEPVAKGEPFGVTATIDNGGTRGEGSNADVDVTTTKLKEKGFRMTGLLHGDDTDDGSFMLATDNSTQMNTLAFSFTEDKWSAGSTTFNWSEGGTQAYDFFAVGNNTGKRSPFITPMAQADNASLDEPIDNEDGVISFPSFVYNLPANAKNQEDLIVASAISKSSGKVGLDFKHALTKIKVQAVYRESFIRGNGRGEDSGTDFDAMEVQTFIKRIVFHGLASSAKFTFGDDPSIGAWSNHVHSTPIVMDFPEDAPAWVKSYDPESYDAENWNSEKMSESTDTGTDGVVDLGYIYAIPEPAYDSDNASTTMIPAWNYVPGQPEVVATDYDEAQTLQFAESGVNSIKDHAYVEIECCMALLGANTSVTALSEIDATTSDDTQFIVYEDDLPNNLACWGNPSAAVLSDAGFESGAGWGKIYLPLKLAQGGLSYNGELTLILNLHRAAKLMETSPGSGSWYYASPVESCAPETSRRIEF